MLSKFMVSWFFCVCLCNKQACDIGSLGLRQRLRTSVLIHGDSLEVSHSSLQINCANWCKTNRLNYTTLNLITHLYLVFVMSVIF